MSHGYDECRPALLSLPGTDPRGDARLVEIVQRVWASLSDADRQGFHRFCCLNSRLPRDLAVIQRIQTQVQAELGDTGGRGEWT